MYIHNYVQFTNKLYFKWQLSDFCSYTQLAIKTFLLTICVTPLSMFLIHVSFAKFKVRFKI